MTFTQYFIQMTLSFIVSLSFEHYGNYIVMTMTMSKVGIKIPFLAFIIAINPIKIPKLMHRSSECPCTLYRLKSNQESDHTKIKIWQFWWQFHHNAQVERTPLHTPSSPPLSSYAVAVPLLSDDDDDDDEEDDDDDMNFVVDEDLSKADKDSR